MNVRYDIELLKKRLGYLEENMAEVKRRITQLEAQCEAQESLPAPAPLPSTPVSAPPLPPSPSPVILPSPVSIPIEPPPLPPSKNAEPPPRSTGSLPVGPVGLERGKATVTGWQPVLRPEPANETNPPRENEPPAWKPWLQTINLWPPSASDAALAGENNTEVRLAAWWTTRIGMALLVIGIVFLGVYFSINANPVVKFAELLGISLAVTAGGLWLERKIPRFGAVVFGGGLALLYFCAFAAHAVPAVRIIESPVAATGWQLAAALLMGGAAWWRRSPVIATIATALAVVSAVFAHARGMPGFALVTVALLAAGGVVFHRWKRWEGPSVVAMPGAYAVYALVWHGSWLREMRLFGEAPAAAAGAWPWVFLAGMLLLHFARDWRGVSDETGAARVANYGERFFQGLNSSFALALGFATAVTLQREHLAVFYFAAAALVGALAALRQWRMRGDVVAAVFAAKATGVFALGLIEIGEGRMMAIQLLAQAWVTFFIARRMRSRFLAGWAGLIALAAYAYFIRHAFGGVVFASFHAAVALLFVTGFSLLASEIARGGDAGRAGGGPGELIGITGALMGTLAAALAAAHMEPEGWGPVALMAFAGAGVGAAWWRRVAGPGVMAGLLTLLAHAELCTLAWDWHGGARVSDAQLLAGMLITGLPTLAAGIVLARKRSAMACISWGGPALWALTIFSGAQVLFELAPARVAVAIMGGLAATLAAVAPWAAEKRCRGLTSLATWTGVLALTLAVVHNGLLAPAGWLGATALLLWFVPVALRMAALPGHRAVREAAPLAAAQEWLQAGCALVFTVNAVQLGLGRTDFPWFLPLALAVTALAVGWLAWRPGVVPALAGSWIVWILSLQGIVMREPLSVAPAPLLEYAVVWMTAVLTWVPARWDVRMAFPSARWRMLIGPAQAGLSVVAAWFLAIRYFWGSGTYIVLIFSIFIAVQVLREWRVAAARWAALALTAGAIKHALERAAAGHAEGFSPDLACIFFLAALVALLPFLISEAPQALSAVARKQLQWVAGAAGLILAGFAASRQIGILAPYVTVIWGLAAIALFMGGLLARARPYRLLGLAGLALCVPRMFFVDLHSALHRIAAFVVLGLVLLWVGFSYHKFRHLIVEETPGDETGNGTDKTESE